MTDDDLTALEKRVTKLGRCVTCIGDGKILGVMTCDECSGTGQVFENPDAAALIGALREARVEQERVELQRFAMEQACQLAESALSKAEAEQERLAGCDGNCFCVVCSRHEWGTSSCEWRLKAEQAEARAARLTGTATRLVKRWRADAAISREQNHDGRASIVEARADELESALVDAEPSPARAKAEESGR